jgi:DNA (cytosine-5)-methyltransferase 1
MRVGSLFAGIGGFDLGLERAGFDIAWQVEIDPYCQRVLAKHWPTVQRYGDIRAVDWQSVEPVDLLCGGFPCQDISLAGKGAGLSGERSGLWFEYAKAIDALRPSYVLIENVAALRSRGLDQVLGSLAALGYDAEWHCIPACAVGAPHRRDRVWIVAYSAQQLFDGGGNAGQAGGIESTDSSEDVADPPREGLEGSGNVTGENRCGKEARLFGCGGKSEWRHWEFEPELGRVAHGIPNRVDRLRGLGNAIVPQIAEWIGRWIQFREEITT